MKMDQKTMKAMRMPVEKSNGYPQTDIGMDDVRVKGKYLTGTKKKTYGTMRGAGAAVRGKKFLDN